MTEASTPGPFTPLSLEELFAKTLPEQVFVVEEILPAGALCLLDGREKSGKGLLSLDLAACVALAEPFLDRAVAEGPAIYCAAEESLRDIRTRVAARFGDRRDAPFYVLPLDGSTGDRLQLDDLIGMQRLHSMIVQIAPRLVVLDPLRELHSGREDLSDEMAPIIRPLRQIAHETGVTIALNHHQNRGGRFRGSTAILAACDLEWALTRTDGDDDTEAAPRGTLRIEGRHGPRVIVRIRLGEELHWELDHTLLLSPDLGARERILTYLKDVNTWKTAVDIAAGASLELKTVQNAFTSMMKQTSRPFAVQGTGHRNGPRQYHMPAPHLEGFGAEDLAK